MRVADNGSSCVRRVQLALQVVREPALFAPTPSAKRPRLRPLGPLLLPTLACSSPASRPVRTVDLPVSGTARLSFEAWDEDLLSSNELVGSAQLDVGAMFGRAARKHRKFRQLEAVVA
eukprot:SAG11_NODE_14599_length_606_cov_1.084813_2_plen_117_part_01